jgi:hypothetical protein
VKTLAVFIVWVVVVVAVAPILAQTPTLVSEYIRLGDRLLAIDSAGVSWSDDFNRPDGSLGANWIVDNPINYPFSVKAEIGSNQMKWYGWKIQALQTPAAAKPQPVQAGLDGQPQWAQIKFTGFVPSEDPHTYIGPAVLYKGTLSPATARGYFVQLVIDDAAGATWGLGLRRLDQPNNTDTVLVPNTPGLIIGDIVRIEVVPGASQNVIRGYRNGNLVFNYTDADVNRVPMQGSPAVYCNYLRTWTGTIGTDTIYLDDFAAGSL